MDVVGLDPDIQIRVGTRENRGDCGGSRRNITFTMMSRGIVCSCFDLNMRRLRALLSAVNSMSPSHERFGGTPINRSPSVLLSKICCSALYTRLSWSMWRMCPTHCYRRARINDITSRVLSFCEFFLPRCRGLKQMCVMGICGVQTQGKF